MAFSRRKYAVSLAVFLFFVSHVCTGVSYGMTDLDAHLTSKQQMQARHVGETVVLRQADGKKLRVKIVSIGESSAVLKNARGMNIDVPYSDVTSVRDGGLSRKATIWIVVGGVFVALGIFGSRV